MHIKTTLAGANFRPKEAKEIVRDLAKNQAVTLQPEPYNEYDSNAIKILCLGEFIGYVARANNVELSQAFEANADLKYVAKVYACDGGLKPIIAIDYDLGAADSDPSAQ